MHFTVAFSKNAGALKERFAISFFLIDTGKQRSFVYRILIIP